LELQLREDKFGQLFVQHFNYFCDYVEYMKNCNNTIKEMRKYIFDTKLQKSLDHIRTTSKRPNDDMMDLILSPMYRIKEYKDFLDKLYEWADRTHEPDYFFLGKASRKIGRVVKWIEMYMHTIINKNEMNKVQQFLDTQCNIITPTRRIIRRGVMTRRTTTWPARNKYYIFFLFNDVLLWTTKKGDLQNLVILRTCVVRPSESRYNQARKFEVESDMPGNKHHKILKLECKDLRQRNDWYNAIKKEVESLQEVRNIKESGEEELIKYIEKNLETKVARKMTPQKSEDTFERKRDDIYSEDEGDLARRTHHRCQSSRNFLAQDINDIFLPLEEMSTSDIDHDQLMDTKDFYGDTMGPFFPNRDEMTTQSKSIIRIQGQNKTSSGGGLHQNGAKMTEKGTFPVSISAPSRNSSVSISADRIQSDLPENLYSSNSHRRKVNVIHRHEKYIKKLQKNSSCTIYLSKLVQ